jgi:hypothetical protein
MNYILVYRSSFVVMKFKNLFIKFVTNGYIVNKYTVTVLFLLVWIAFFDRFDLYSQLADRKKREKYLMKKNGEDIFLMIDTIKVEKE